MATSFHCGRQFLGVRMQSPTTIAELTSVSRLCEKKLEIWVMEKFSRERLRREETECMAIWKIRERVSEKKRLLTEKK